MEARLLACYYADGPNAGQLWIGGLGEPEVEVLVRENVDVTAEGVGTGFLRFRDGGGSGNAGGSRDFSSGHFYCPQFSEYSKNN